jgi:hypothetical protein
MNEAADLKLRAGRRESDVNVKAVNYTNRQHDALIAYVSL